MWLTVLSEMIVLSEYIDLLWLVIQGCKKVVRLYISGLAGAVPPALQSFRFIPNIVNYENICKRISNRVRIPLLCSSEFILR